MRRGCRGRARRHGGAPSACRPHQMACASLPEAACAAVQHAAQRGRAAGGAMPNAPLRHSVLSAVRTYLSARRACGRIPAVAAKWESTVHTHAPSTSPSCSDCITATQYKSPSCSASSLKPISNRAFAAGRANPGLCTAQHSGRAQYAPIVTGATPRASASCSSAEVRWSGRVTHANAAAPHASAATRWSSPAVPDAANKMPRADSEEDCQWSRGQNRARCFSGTAGRRSLCLRVLLHRDAQRLLNLSPEHIGAEPPERPVAHACAYREVLLSPCPPSRFEASIHWLRRFHPRAMQEDELAMPHVRNLPSP
jgi:hypothetical protein